MFTLHEIYDMAITLEKNGIKFYQEALQRVSDQRVRRLLAFLLEEEQNHLETFSRLKEEHSAQNPPAKNPPPGMENLLHNIMSGRLLSWEERPLIQEGTPFKDILEAALEFEKDGLLFFQFMREMLDSTEDQGAMDRILEEEKKHVEKLESVDL